MARIITGRRGENIMPMRNPPDPGDFIKTEIVEAFGFSVTDAAVALRIEKAFGVERYTLMRMWSA
jgi:plasmid maintenance system antidote protein VapI